MISRDLTIVDNFFDNPDEVRNYAISAREYDTCDFYSNTGIYSGYRNPVIPIVRELITNKFKSIFNKNFTRLSLSFHLNTKSSVMGVPHKDNYGDSGLDIAGVIYLNKDAPKETGTFLYDDDSYKSEKYIEDYTAKTQVLYDVCLPPSNPIKLKIAREILRFKNSLNAVHYSENIYNRLIFYSAKGYHSPGYYFGENLEDGRLTISIHGKFDAE